MKYILRRNRESKRYKGIIAEPEIRDFFLGKIWSREHAPFSKEKLDCYISRSFFKIKPAISIKPSSPSLFGKRYFCNRCHNDNQREFVEFDCARCGKACVYCRHCINMGRMSCCTELLVWNGPSGIFPKRHVFDWNGSFTVLQQQAAEELRESIGRKRNHLLHAVCGAGKTEILFPAVFHCLRKGWRICIATPRTDVVLELFPRFQKAFPNTIMHAYYGDAPEQKGLAQLVIATTHQLYRFEKAFDVVIVDEADAFPYTYDRSLQKAVWKARKEGAPVAFVTATPTSELLTKVKKERWGCSFIPRRYHGHPLPVPRFEPLWFYDRQIDKGKLPKKLMHWTKRRLGREEPFFIFFPAIPLMEKAIPLFQEIHPDICGVHAKDSERKEKVMKLRNGEIPGLLTTTILERGVTIKNVQVAVVGAESKIFTSGALIQISGRAGRHADFPNGDIVFFHHGISVEMDAARNEILRLNKEGFRT
ncbi:DEAD/DEAH box helicase [Ureibacillus terrenus]|uniref:DEAD/DEAH box helicase n=1 Tax=Ureibacillus terrenus TaxID=118246 RepID=A0A540V3V3_9BACL|nr:DEAD/DEAH box helicase family protein [Ureibacillus terrenus]TQE91425.1 DEAD/DEAH box helicase [Ureibacillus terrenus]